MTEILHPNYEADAAETAMPIEAAIADVSPNPGSHPEQLSRTRKATRSLLLAGGLGALTFQQLPTNEAVRTAVTLEVFEETDSKPLATTASGLLTFGIEGGTSTLIAMGVTREQGAVNRFIERYRKRKSEKNALDDAEQEVHKDLSLSRKLTRGLGNTGLALGLGPGILVVKKHITGENTSTRDALKTGLGYSVLGSVVSAGVFGYGITSGAEGANSAAADTPAEAVVEFATDPKMWVAGLALGGLAYGIKRIRERDNHANEQEVEL